MIEEESDSAFWSETSAAGLVASMCVMLFLGVLATLLMWGLVSLGLSDSGQGWSGRDTINLLVAPLAAGLGVLIHIVGRRRVIYNGGRTWPFVVTGWLVAVGVVLAWARLIP